MTTMVDLAREPFREAETSAGTIRYRDVGSGPVLLFVHGLLFNGLLWRKVVAQLTERFRCVVPDLPMGGHALAVRPDADLRPPGLARIVLDLVEHVGGPVTLVGNDTGGALCQLAAAELVVSGRTGLLDGMVLTDCDLYENFLPPVFRVLQAAGYVPGSIWLTLQAMRLRSLWGLPPAYGRIQRSPVDPGVVDGYFSVARRRRAVRRDVAKVLRGIHRRYTMEAAAELVHLDRPVLFAWAKDDKVFPIAGAERLAGAIGDARLETIEDSLALVPEDQPRRLAALIADWAETRNTGAGLSGRDIRPIR